MFTLEWSADPGYIGNLNDGLLLLVLFTRHVSLVLPRIEKRKKQRTYRQSPVKEPLKQGQMIYLRNTSRGAGGILCRKCLARCASLLLGSSLAGHPPQRWFWGWARKNAVRKVRTVTWAWPILLRIFELTLRGRGTPCQTAHGIAMRSIDQVSDFRRCLLGSLCFLGSLYVSHTGYMRKTRRHLGSVSSRYPSSFIYFW